MLVGVGLRAVELAAEFAKERSAFGVPIGRFQAVAFPLADDLTALDGVRLLSWKSQWAAQKQLDSAGLLALMAYASAAEAAMRAVAHALHTHGGQGLTEECDIQLYHRRAKFLAVIAGDPKHSVRGYRRRSAATVGGGPMIEFSLPDSAVQLVSEVKDFLDEHLTPAVREHERRTGDGHNWEFNRALAQKRWVLPTWPVEMGGAGLGDFAYALLIQELYRAEAPLVGVNTTQMPAAVIRDLGPDHLQRRILPEIAAGRRLSASASPNLMPVRIWPR